MVLFAGLYLLLFAQDAAVPAGTRVQAKLQSSVQTSKSKMGDPVAAILTAPIRVKNQTIVPGGSRLNGRIETVDAATRKTTGRVRLVFREIELADGRRIPTWITNSFGASAPNRARRHVLYTLAGATAGAFVGGKTARVSGILGGAIVGLVIATNTGDGNLPDLTLRAGQVVDLQLGQDLRVAAMWTDELR
jgi:hypothetical protein